LLSIFGDRQRNLAMAERTVKAEQRGLDNRWRAMGPMAPILTAIGVTVTSAILIAAAMAITSTREETLTAGEANLRRIDFVLAGSVERLMAAVDRQLGEIAEDLGTAGQGFGDGQALHLRLQQSQASLPGTLRLSVFDTAGQPVDTSWPQTVPGTLVTDRTYFSGQRDRRDAGLLVGEPVQGRLDGRWTFMVSRRIDGPGGAFRGVVAASFDLNYFDALFTAAAPETGARVALLRNDLVLLFRHPQIAGFYGRSMAWTPASAAIFAGNRTEGSGRFVSGTDSRPIVAAARRLERYPFAIAMAVPEETLLAPWRRLVLGIGAAAALAVLGVTALLVILWRQITRRHASEQALAEERGRLWQVLDTSNDGFWEWHLGSGLVDWSERCCALMGLSAAGGVLHIEQVMAMIHPDDRDHYRSALRRHIEADEPFAVEVRWHPPGGGLRWMASRGRIVRDRDGHPLSLVGAHTDITERKAIERRLLGAGEPLSALGD
jgi:PAS domain S-box-containing protein